MGKFENFDKVTDFLKKNRLNNLPNTLIYLDKDNKDLDYYVLVGPFYDKIEAKNFQKTLKKDLKNSIVSLKSLDKDK
ncbi:MAG: SPOR domain-containing protein [Saprospiraceae bacterium]|nr:SPOR domain-containing protein [Saprospiraceae bacterium]